MIKRSVLVLPLFLFAASTGRADSLYLKSGEILRGKLVEKTESTYVFHLDSGGDDQEIPVSRVSIADFDPDFATSPKGSMILYSTSGKAAVSKTDDTDKQTYRPVAVVDGAGGGIKPMKSPLDAVNNAEATVALANARTAEVQKRMEEFKAAADSANQDTPPASGGASNTS